MNRNLDPKQVFESYKKKEISKEEALKFLKIVLEKSENFILRINSLRILGDLAEKNDYSFRFFENTLISDEIQEIRALSSEIILDHYIPEGLNTLKWAIMNENSAQVLSRIRIFLNNSIDPIFTPLKNALDERMEMIASNFDVNINEVQFLLDLEIQLTMNTLFEFYNQLQYISQENFMCVIKNQHITEINLASYCKIPKTIGHIKYLETLNLSNNNFYELPQELMNLKHLKSLDLSWNDFKEIPKELKSLNALEELNMSNNFITKVPEWIPSLENLDYLNLRDNKIEVIPDLIKNSKIIKFLQY